jgi:C1A family cysteine protease
MNRKLSSILAAAVLLCTTSCGRVADLASGESSGSIPDSYSLIEEGYVVPVVNQAHGTCWANTGAQVMRYDLMVTSGADLDINVNDFVRLSFSADPEEGREGFYSNNGPDIGGTHQLIVATATGYGIDGYFLTEANDYSAASREVIQEKIMTRGALSLDITVDEHYIRSIRNNATLNIPDEKSEDITHVVTIVGWDNNFSADEFDPPASGNGAWLIQDSQGSNFGDNGF